MELYFTNYFSFTEQMVAKPYYDEDDVIYTNSDSENEDILAVNKG